MMRNSDTTKIKILLLALVLVFVAFTFIACSEDDDNKFEHTVTHNSADYDTAGKYVFEQGQTATVSFFVKFDSDMPDSVADEGIYVDLRAGDTIISKFNVAHTAADMDAGITVDVPIPTDTLGTTDYHIILLSKYGAGCGGSSSHATRIDFVVEVIEPASDSSGTDSDSGTDDDAGSTDGTDGTDGTDDDDDDNGTDGTDDDDDDNGTGDTSAAQTGAGASGFAITAQPVSTSVAVGAPLTLSVSASGSGTLTYQWYTSLTNSYNGIEMIGKTSNTVSLSTSNPFTQYYYCVVTQVSTGATLTTNIAMASAVGSAPTPTPTPTPVPTSYDIWVTGIEVTPDNADDILGDESAYYDAATNTLYIQANIERSAEQDLTGDPYKDAAIGASRDLKIESLGSSDIYIINNNHTATTGLTRGIYVTGNLTIVSNHTMRVQLETNGSDGVYVTGNLSTSGDKNIYVNGGDGNESYIHGGKGIYCGGKIVVGNGLYGFGGYGASDSSGNGGIGIDARISVETIASYNAIKGEGGDGGIKSGTRGMGGAGIKTPEVIVSGHISGIAGSDNTGVDDIVYE